jgi:hypothetical protein
MQGLSFRSPFGFPTGSMQQRQAAEVRPPPQRAEAIRGLSSCSGLAGLAGKQGGIRCAGLSVSRSAARRLRIPINDAAITPHLQHLTYVTMVPPLEKVKKVPQCSEKPAQSPFKVHEEALKRIGRYLAGTKHQGMRYCRTSSSTLKLDCWCDADFAGLWGAESSSDPNCVRSRSGFVLTIGDLPVVWSSKLQTLIALSSTESELMAVSSAMRALLPMRELLFEIGSYIDLPIDPCLRSGKIIRPVFNWRTPRFPALPSAPNIWPFVSGGFVMPFNQGESKSIVWILLTIGPISLQRVLRRCCSNAIVMSSWAGPLVLPIQHPDLRASQRDEGECDDTHDSQSLAIFVKVIS